MKRFICAALSFVCILSQCSNNNVPEAPVYLRLHRKCII